VRGIAVVNEMPIIRYDRNLGPSKMDLRIISEAVRGVIRLHLRG